MKLQTILKRNLERKMDWQEPRKRRRRLRRLCHLTSRSRRQTSRFVRACFWVRSTDITRSGPMSRLSLKLTKSSRDSCSLSIPWCCAAWSTKNQGSRTWESKSKSTDGTHTSWKRKTQSPFPWAGVSSKAFLSTLSKETEKTTECAWSSTLLSSVTLTLCFTRQVAQLARLLWVCRSCMRLMIKGCRRMCHISESAWLELWSSWIRSFESWRNWNWLESLIKSWKILHL